MGDWIAGGVEGGGLVTIGGDDEVGDPNLRFWVDPEEMEVGGKMNFPLSNDFETVAGEKDCFMRLSLEEVVGGAPPPRRWWAWCEPVISGGGTGTPADWAK